MKLSDIVLWFIETFNTTADDWDRIPSVQRANLIALFNSK